MVSFGHQKQMLVVLEELEYKLVFPALVVEVPPVLIYHKDLQDYDH